MQHKARDKAKQMECVRGGRSNASVRQFAFFVFVSFSTSLNAYTVHTQSHRHGQRRRRRTHKPAGRVHVFIYKSSGTLPFLSSPPPSPQNSRFDLIKPPVHTHTHARTYARDFNAAVSLFGLLFFYKSHAGGRFSTKAAMPSSVSASVMLLVIVQSAWSSFWFVCGVGLKGKG